MHHLVLLLATAALLSQTHSGKAAVTSRNSKNAVHIFKSSDGSAFALNDKPIKKFVPGMRQFLNITQRPPTRVRFEAGATLACEAVGAPAPTLLWYINDQPATEPSQDLPHIPTSLTSVARVTSSLRLRNVREDDVITCRARAGHLVRHTHTTVEDVDSSTDLSERHKLLPLQPLISFSYKMYMDTIGKSVVLPCKVKGHPRPLVVWRDNNGAKVVPNERIKVLRNGSLVISELRWSDMGDFSCEATNEFGTVAVNTFIYPVKAG